MQCRTLSSELLALLTVAVSLARLDREGRHVRLLIRLLSDPESLVCRDVVTALGQMGPRAKPAVPALLKLLKDNDREVRDGAGEALLKIDPAAAGKAGVD